LQGASILLGIEIPDALHPPQVLKRCGKQNSLQLRNFTQCIANQDFGSQFGY